MTHQMQGKIDITRISTGHKQHMSGAGVHNNKKDKRNNTRSAKIRKILNQLDN